MRKAEVYFEGKYIEVPFSSIKRGDMFRLFESDNNEPVKDSDGKTEWYALKDARFSDRYGAYEIVVDAGGMGG